MRESLTRRRWVWITLDEDLGTRDPSNELRADEGTDVCNSIRTYIQQSDIITEEEGMDHGFLLNDDMLAGGHIPTGNQDPADAQTTFVCNTDDSDELRDIQNIRLIQGRRGDT